VSELGWIDLVRGLIKGGTRGVEGEGIIIYVDIFVG
jgi:hypothetical protein